ncbi:MAG: hypothetical protein KBG84_04095 [Planctomycetes bacterium]|nr:hypothetical protein [Planctomycetota bacterium]
MTDSEQDEAHSDDALIRERLNSLLSEHSQSEIARKTGSLVASVNRYVHGARVPAAFCASLVRGLNVNPSWLLVGEGAPNLADVPAETAKLGENLLALVEAMSAVARMRLGSLTGKHHLKVLRELNDALAAHERLREKLNEQSRPLFAQMLKDLQSALDKRDLARAGELRKAVEQISRLCDDENLARDFYRAQAYHEFQLKNSHKFLQLQRKLFLHSLPDGSLFDERACDEARRLVVALVQMNHMKEAARICRAVRDLAGAKGRKWDSFARLENTYGVILAETGRLRRGISLIQKSLPRLGGLYRKVSEAALMKFMLWAGLLRIEDAARMGEHTDAKAEHMLQLACWQENTEALRCALKYADAPDVEPIWRNTFYSHYAHALMRLFEKPALRAGRDFRSEVEGSKGAPTDAMDRARLAAAAAHLSRLGGDAAGAKEETQRAQNELKSVGREVHPDPMMLATHYRNVLALGGETKRARKFFREYTRHGYACFSSVETKPAR